MSDIGHKARSGLADLFHMVRLRKRIVIIGCVCRVGQVMIIRGRMEEGAGWTVNDWKGTSV